MASEHTTARARSTKDDANEVRWWKILSALVESGKWAELGEAERGLLVIFLVKSDRDGKSWWSATALAGMAGLTRRGFQKANARLIKKNLIRREWDGDFKHSAVTFVLEHRDAPREWKSVRVVANHGSLPIPKQTSKVASEGAPGSALTGYAVANIGAPDSAPGGNELANRGAPQPLPDPPHESFHLNTSTNPTGARVDGSGNEVWVGVVELQAEYKRMLKAFGPETMRELPGTVVAELLKFIGARPHAIKLAILRNDIHPQRVLQEWGSVRACPRIKCPIAVLVKRLGLVRPAANLVCAARGSGKGGR